MTVDVMALLLPALLVLAVAARCSRSPPPAGAAVRRAPEDARRQPFPG